MFPVQVVDVSVFDLLEVRQHVLPTPSIQTEICPDVIILMVASGVQHVVYGSGAS